MGSSIETAACCEYSFAAAAGWDAVTGLGSPNFQILSNLVLNISIPFPSVDASVAYSAIQASGEGTTDVTNQNSQNTDRIESIAIAGLVLACIAFFAIFALLVFIYISRNSNGETFEVLLNPSKY